MYSAFLQKRFHCYPKNKNAYCFNDVESNPRSEVQKSAREKANSVAQQLREMKLPAAAKKVEDSIEETLTYVDYNAFNQSLP